MVKMGCNACDMEQLNPQLIYFMRVGAANVQVVACGEHMAELRRIYLLGLHADQDAPLESIQGYKDADKHAHDWAWLDTVCPECGIKWRFVSPTCPRVIYNRHPRG